MRIAVTSALSWPYVRRGSRIAYELAVYLAGRGHHVTYISTKPGREMRLRRADGLRLEYHPLAGHPLLSALRIPGIEAFALSCLASLLRGRFDVVQAVFSVDAFAAALYKRLTGTPLVLYMIDRAELLHLLPRRGGFMLRRAVAAADRIAVMSRFVERDLREGFGREARIVPGTVDAGQFPPKTEPPAGPPRILCTASLTAPRKRVELLVRAFDRLRERVPEARLILSGHTDAATSRRLLAAVRPENRGAVTIPGVGRREDLPALYRDAWVTALPSVDEAFGLVLLESLASGTPVVATRSGAVPDIVDDPAAGVLFEAEEGPDGLARALERGLALARSPETPGRCSALARRYTWDAVGPRFEEIYEEVVRRRGSRTSRGARVEPTKEEETMSEESAAAPAPRGRRALERAFDDALDALEITYDTYWEIDFHRPRVLALAAWLLGRGPAGGRALVLGGFPRPAAMFLAHLGWDVQSRTVMRRLEPWREIEDPLLLEQLEEGIPAGPADLVVVDDLFESVARPRVLLEALRDRLIPGGRLLLCGKNVARGTTRLRLLAGRNVYPGPDEDLWEAVGDGRPLLRVHPYREYTAVEAASLLEEAGFEIEDRRYLVGTKAAVPGLLGMPLASYAARKAYALLQRLAPPLRSHFLVAARRPEPAEEPA